MRTTKSQLKKLIKPIVKECINEVLLEQGVLSNIISEVVKGVQPLNTPAQPTMFASNKELVTQQKELAEQKRQMQEEQHQRLKEQKRKLLDAAGFGTDIFEGTDPIKGGITNETKDHSGGQAGALAGVDPSDPGVDIAGIMQVANRDWSKMI